MRSATLLAFVDWRPSAVKRVILLSTGGCGLALELGRASLCDGAPEEPCLSRRRRASAGSPAGSEAGAFRRAARAAKAAPTSLQRRP